MQVAEGCLDPEQIQFAEEQFVSQNPFTAGAAMVKVRLLLAVGKRCHNWPEVEVHTLQCKIGSCLCGEALE